MIDISPAIVPGHGGVSLTIEVTAGAKEDRFPSGYNPWRKAIGCTVSAPATGGRANRAVLGLITRVLSLDNDRIEIVTGSRSSLKRIALRGIDEEWVRARLVQCLEKETQ